MPLLRTLILQAAAAGGRRLPDWLKQTVYRTPLLSTGLRWALTRAAPAERVVVEVAGGIARGARLRLDLKTEKYYWLGTHEISVQRALARETRPGMVGYDVGAHIGFFTLGLAQLVGPGGRVHAFEPAPESVRALRENLSLNAARASCVEVVEAAVLDNCGRIQFQAEGGLSTAHVRQAGEGSALDVEVECLTLDHYVFARGQTPPHVVKIDVEGAEGMALAGARRLLRGVRPLWLVEVHSQETARLIWEEFQQADYRLLTLDRTEAYHSPGEIAGRHALAVPRSEG